MNALNRSATLHVTTVRPPLVVDLGRGYFAWIEKGHGFTLSAASGQWQPMVDAEGLGGHVLTASQVVALVAAYGRPVLP